MAPTSQARRWTHPGAVLLCVLAGLIAVLGSLATLGVWAVMGMYPDDKSNTGWQTVGPFLVYALPAWAVALGLVALARRIAGKAARTPRG
jgi:hypothetical protein